MKLKKDLVKILAGTLEYLEKHIYYEDFLDHFAMFFNDRLGLNICSLYFINNEYQHFELLPKQENTAPVKFNSYLAQYLKNNQEPIDIRQIDGSVQTLLEKDQDQLFRLQQFDWILPIDFNKELVAFILLNVNSGRIRDITQIHHFFKLLMTTITPKILFERYAIHNRKNFLKRFRYDKLALGGKMAASASHEIKNLLGSFSATIEYLNELEQISRQDLTENFSQIQTALDQANNILKSMMSIAKYEEMRFETLNLSGLVDELLDLLYFRYSKNIEIERIYQENIIIKTSRQFLSQALINILLNSIDAIGQASGKITINISRIQSDHDGQESRYWISVIDSGPGFDAHILKNLFVQYQTTKNDGTGLGLYNTKNLIEKIGGEIHIRNLERGAEIKIILPEAVQKC